jgi:hypothetical protein
MNFCGVSDLSSLIPEGPNTPLNISAGSNTPLNRFLHGIRPHGTTFEFEYIRVENTDDPVYMGVDP